MAQYTRSTQECGFYDLRPEIREAVVKYAENRGLVDLPNQVTLCAQTTSVKVKRGFLDSLFGGDPEGSHTTAVMATPEWLIWVRLGDKSGAVPMMARFKDIEVRNFQSPLPQIQDTGLDVHGLVGDNQAGGTGFIGLGDNPAARDFGNRLIAWAARQRG